MGMIRYIQKYFWDIDPKKAAPKKHPRYYSARILEKGDKRAVDWLFRVFGKKRVKRMLPGIKLSPKSANYWRRVFRLS